MTTKPASLKQQPVLVTIALSPFRAIERTRGWRRPLLLAFYTLIAAVLAAFLWRRSQLAGLPDVGEPFDVAAFRSPARVPDDRNVFVLYRQASDRYREMTDAEVKSFNNANLEWTRADATLRRWVSDNDEALSLFRAGSARPEFVLEISDDFAVEAAMAANNELASHLGSIGTAGIFKAGRLRAEGDRAGAWTLLNAIARASRHMQWAAPTANGRMHGIMLTQYSRELVAAWANDPAVIAPMLCRALADLAIAEALTPPLSITYRQEYLRTAESLKNPQSLIAAQTKPLGAPGSRHFFAFLPPLDAFLSAEPERSRRVLNLLVANDLAWCDRPVDERPPVAVPRLHIYQPDPAAPAASRALAPEELARWSDSTLIPIVTWRLGEIEEMEKIDRWSMSALTQSVAVSLFTKDVGHPPASAAEALKRYRPSPADAPRRDETNPVP